MLRLVVKRVFLSPTADYDRWHGLLFRPALVARRGQVTLMSPTEVKTHQRARCNDHSRSPEKVIPYSKVFRPLVTKRTESTLCSPANHNHHHTAHRCRSWVLSRSSLLAICSSFCACSRCRVSRCTIERCSAVA